MSQIAHGTVKRLSRLFTVLSSLICASTWAASWEIVPTLAVTETYTDNVSLAPDASRQEDWISEVVPGISIVGDGARLRFNATYSPQFLYYLESEREETNHRLGVAADAELARQLLFLDIGANVDQYNASVQGPLGTSNVNTTGNRETVKTFSASPYLRRDFRSEIQAEARLTYSAVNSDNASTLADSSSERVDLLVNSGPKFKRLTWDFGYARENIDNDGQLDISTEVTSANTRRLITSTVSVLGQVGYEHYKQGVAPATEGTSWSAGLGWAPTVRTNFVATAGKRFFGDAYLLDFTHRTRLTTWGVGFTQDVTNTRRYFFVPSTTSTASYLDALFSSQFPDPESRQKAVDEFIAQTGLPADLSAPTNFFANQLFVEKRWQASAGVVGVRNVVIANVFRQTRESVDGNLVLPSSLGFTANERVIQTGIGIVWDWKLTAQNALTINLAYGRNEIGASRSDNTFALDIGLTRRIQPRLFGAINFQTQSRDSDQSFSDYKENSVIATIRKQF